MATNATEMADSPTNHPTANATPLAEARGVVRSKMMASTGNGLSAMAAANGRRSPNELVTSTF
jgi:hypothetical protein